ncbi:MAG: SusD/RagB family nutrient-binding outer membrane lipoprotein [Alistipes sp.]
MKNIFKITFLLLSVAGFTGCTGNFEEYNSDPYALYKADPTVLLPSMIDAMMFVQQNDSQMIDQMVGSLGGYFTLSNRWGGQNFDTFNASDGWNAGPYNTMFTKVYANYFDIEKATNKSGHYYAMAQLVRAAVMMRVVDCYGGVPYSKVANGSFYVEYDSSEESYKHIIEDLSSAATTLYAYAEAFPSTKPLAGHDPIFNGDYSAWARLANSLTLRVAIRTNDKAAAEAAMTHAAGLIETNAQNAMMDPGVQGNPYQLAGASWGDIRVNSSIVDYMNGYNDPRCPAYFQKSGFVTDRYIGMRAGTADFQKDAVQGYSLPKIESSSSLPVFVAAETQFLRAEAALKGWTVVGTAQSNYEKGISLSCEQHKVASESIATYLANNTLEPADHKDDPRGAKFNYDRATTVKIKWSDEGTAEQKLEQIITQKWIANFPMGLEAWAEFRRTGYPELAPTIDNLSNGAITSTARGLRRLRYPYTEKNLNRANYTKAVAQLGGTDNESVDLFWAKKN